MIETKTRLQGELSMALVWHGWIMSGKLKLTVALRRDKKGHKKVFYC